MAFTNKKKKYDTDSVVAGVDDVVTSNNTPVQDEVKPSEKTVTVPVVTANDLLNPPVEKKKKLAAVYLRCKSDVKTKFDKFCKEKGISQSDLFEYWVETLLK